MQNHNDDTIKTSGHSSLEKYTSHFIERVVCERELETEQNCNILTPTLLAITVFLSRSPGLLNRAPGGPASLGHGSHSSIFSPTDLNFLSPGLYNNLTSTYFLRASQFRTQFNPSTVNVTPDLLISSTGCTCYLHRCISSFYGLAGSKVNIKHYRLRIIFKQTYLTHRWGSNSYYHSGLEWTGCNGNVEILPRSSELEPHHEMQFSVMPKTPILVWVSPLCRGYSQCILSPADRTLFVSNRQWLNSLPVNLLRM